MLRMLTVKFNHKILSMCLDFNNISFTENPLLILILILTHCVKSDRFRSFSGPYFPAFGLNTERYSVSLFIQYECGKMRTRKTPNTETFYEVTVCANMYSFYSYCFYILLFLLLTFLQFLGSIQSHIFLLHWSHSKRM